MNETYWISTDVYQVTRIQYYIIELVFVPISLQVLCKYNLSIVVWAKTQTTIADSVSCENIYDYFPDQNGTEVQKNSTTYSTVALKYIFSLYFDKHCAHIESILPKHNCTFVWSKLYANVDAN